MTMEGIAANPSRRRLVGKNALNANFGTTVPLVQIQTAVYRSRAVRVELDHRNKRYKQPSAVACR